MIVCAVGKWRGLVGNRLTVWSIVTPVACLAYVLWLSSRALGGIRGFDYDAGLYHVPAIKWIENFPIVPGLANLHSRFGINSTSLLFDAFAEQGSWSITSLQIANSLLLAVMGTVSVASIVRLLRNPRRAPVEDWFWAFLLAPVIRHGFDHACSSSTDLPVFVVAMVMCAHLCRLFFQPISNRDKARIAVTITVFACTGITLKHSFAVLAVAAIVVSWAAAIHTRCAGLLRRIVCTVSVAALILVPWGTANVLLTGYALYPFVIAGIQVPWKVDKSVAVNEMVLARNWARQPGGASEIVSHGFRWVFPWCKRLLWPRNIFDALFPWFVGAAALLTILSSPKTALRLKTLGFAFPAVLALCAWFFVAPDPRFVWAASWWWGGGMAAIAGWGFGTRGKSRLASAVLLGIAACFIAAQCVWHGGILDASRFSGYPAIQTTTTATVSGLILNVPVGSEQCWNANLPCTPIANPGLRLRVPGKLDKGFVVDAIPDVTREGGGGR